MKQARRLTFGLLVLCALAVLSGPAQAAACVASRRSHSSWARARTCSSGSTSAWVRGSTASPWRCWTHASSAWMRTWGSGASSAVTPGSPAGWPPAGGFAIDRTMISLIRHRSGAPGAEGARE